MLKAIVDRTSLMVAALRVHDIHVKLLKGERLTEKEEEKLKLYLWGIEGSERSFRDDKHRLQLIEQWWRDAKHLNKKLKDQEEKPK